MKIIKGRRCPTRAVRLIESIEKESMNVEK